MSYIAMHKLKDGYIHCPRTGVCNRAVPMAHDSHLFRCPACNTKHVLRERSVVTILRELVEVPETMEARRA